MMRACRMLCGSAVSSRGAAPIGSGRLGFSSCSAMEEFSRSKDLQIRRSRSRMHVRMRAQVGCISAAVATTCSSPLLCSMEDARTIETSSAAHPCAQAMHFVSFWLCTSASRTAPKWGALRGKSCIECCRGHPCDLGSCKSASNLLRANTCLSPFNL